MQYRTMKKTGDNLSMLGFGLMRLPKKGRKVDEERATNNTLRHRPRGELPGYGVQLQPGGVRRQGARRRLPGESEYRDQDVASPDLEREDMEMMLDLVAA